MRKSSLLTIVLLAGSGCARARAVTPPVESSAAPPPVVWTERETLDGPMPTFRNVDMLDLRRYIDMQVGVAHGPSRADEAQRVTSTIENLGLPVHDTWSVDAHTWFMDGPQTCRDQVVYYTDEAAPLAAALQSRLPAALALTRDAGSDYDVIVQLCPREGTGSAP